MPQRPMERDPLSSTADLPQASDASAMMMTDDLPSSAYPHTTDRYTSAVDTEAAGRGMASEYGTMDRSQAGNDKEALPGHAAARVVRPRPLALDVQKVVDDTAEKVAEAFLGFLEGFSVMLTSVDDDVMFSGDVLQGPKYYVDRLRRMVMEDRSTLYVDYSHVFSEQQLLAEALLEHYYRFEPFLRRAVQVFGKRHVPNYIQPNSAGQQMAPQPERQLNLGFYNLPVQSRIRELRTDRVGKLACISGTVTRTSQVRPELVRGMFRCKSCNTIAHGAIEQQFKYTEPGMCQTPTCLTSGEWELLTGLSTFVDWQKVRVQENSSEIPAGSMPRSLDIILRDEVVEMAKPGDRCIFTGTLIVVPDVSQLSMPGSKAEVRRDNTQGRGREGYQSEGATGLKALGVRDLTYRLAFLASSVQSADAKDRGREIGLDPNVVEDTQSKLLESFTQEEIDDLKRMVQMENQIYSKLVDSLAPTVYGHDDVKKGVLLQLMGGVHKVTPEGIHLRGDINVCLVGDPSTSKSQFLRYVVGFSPRAVFTSGKASSAAGLTASVVKDEETGEFTIEAGALMLADNGICAIDEFDKMDIVDQVAIHEAMEQQTISIAKAGVQATLNARTSILAAANPIGGRYDRRLTLRQNISLSAPIMSRFDLFFVILDECNETADYNIARHIVNVHRLRDDAVAPEFSTAQLRRYIRFARTFRPKITAEAQALLWELYRNLRQNDAQAGNRRAYRITVRQLESLIRLSEALARVHCDREVQAKYVREAFRLLQRSIIQVESDDVYLADDTNQTPLGVQSARDALESSSTPHDQEEEAMATDNALANDSQGQRTVIDRVAYERIRNTLVAELRRIEQSEDVPALRRSEAIMWYLEETESEIQTAEELEEAQRMIRLVIAHLVRRDNVLIEIRDIAPYQQDSGASEDGEDPILMVHPSYVGDMD